MTNARKSDRSVVKFIPRESAFNGYPDIDANNAHWQFFVDCYNKTYHDHGSMPYLNLEFFTRLGKSMPENVLLILALQDGEPVAASLQFT